MAKSFPQADITGIDRSPEFLDIARQHSNKISNLSFQLADLYDLPFSDNSIDFIYVRLVLMHLADPMLALNSFKRVLRPGGRLLIEDADRSCMFFEPEPQSFTNFWQKVQEGQRRLGGDPNIGRKLASLLCAADFQQLQNEVQPIVGGGAEIAFLVHTLMPSLNLYLEPAERPRGAIAISDLQALSKDRCASFYHFWFVVSGEKTTMGR
jgi:SAM-dependent methyltransferase